MTFADRAVAGIGFRLQQAFARKLADVPAPPAPPVRDVSRLRYLLRRDGLRPELLDGCFALQGGAAGGHVLAAARRLAAGGVVELAEPRERHAALALAALAHALHGESVHVIAASEPAAQALKEALGAPLGAFGLRVAALQRAMSAPARREAYAADVVCATHREIAQDYLRDRLLDGERRGGALVSRLQRLQSGGEQLMPRGLQCALVDDADLVMLDDALAPAAIAADVDQSRERLLYEQALELARALTPDMDFTREEDGIRLTEPAARLLERLVTPLGGVWSASQRREQLVGLALEALHVLERDVDYRVANGRVEFPRPPGGEEPTPADEERQKLVEVKEGCRLSARRELLARLPMPRFFARYRHLAGVCADARSLEREFWGFYRLKTWLAGERESAPPPAARVFVDTAAKNAALVTTLRERAAAGRAVVIGVASARDGQALQQLLHEAQIGGELAIALLPAVQGMPAGRTADLLIAGLPDSRRHIELARRACGAGGCELLLALDEEAVVPRLGLAGALAARFLAGPGGELAPRWALRLAQRAQRAAERASSGVRLDLKAREEMLDDLLAFSGQRE